MASGASPASASTASRRETGAMPSHESPTFTSTVSGTESGSAPSIASRSTGISRSTSSRGASSSSSSWTESRTRERNDPSCSARSVRIIAIFTMSAAVPWIGMLIAIRSPAARSDGLRASSSGIFRLRPSSVAT